MFHSVLSLAFPLKYDMPLAEVKAIVPHASSQMQLRTSRDALAHVRDWGEEGDRYEARIAEEKQKRSPDTSDTSKSSEQNIAKSKLLCPDMS